MSCHAHHQEIQQDEPRLRMAAQVRSFADLQCPFCGCVDLFVYPPGTHHRTGVRTWWTIGCDSPRCNSCWTMNVDRYETAISKMEFAQPKKMKGKKL